jgi:hypothetical protein
MKDLTEKQLQGLVYTLSLALDDQQEYLDKMSLDYDEEGLRSKGESFRQCATAVQILGNKTVADAFEQLATDVDELADEKRLSSQRTPDQAEEFNRIERTIHACLAIE